MSRLCEQCGGRGVIAVGTHEDPCAACDGTGRIAPKAKPAMKEEDKAKSDAGASSR